MKKCNDDVCFEALIAEVLNGEHTVERLKDNAAFEFTGPFEAYYFARRHASMQSDVVYKIIYNAM